LQLGVILQKQEQCLQARQLRNTSIRRMDILDIFNEKPENPLKA
jgi:hypothetical protein